MMIIWLNFKSILYLCSLWRKRKKAAMASASTCRLSDELSDSRLRKPERRLSPSILHPSDPSDPSARCFFSILLPPTTMPLLEEQLKPWFESLGLASLTYHWHIILLSSLACNFILQTSVALSPLVFPKAYPKLQGFKRANWDIHIVSMVHCVTIVLGALPMLWDPELLQDKVFGYSSWAGNVYAIACGYFLWDIFISIKYWKEQGIWFVFHGICSFAAYILSFVSIPGLGNCNLQGDLVWWFNFVLIHTASIPELLWCRLSHVRNKYVVSQYQLVFGEFLSSR